MVSLTISIDRTGMVGSPAPLVLVSDRADPASNIALGCSGFREPAKRMRRRIAPPSDFLHGDVVLGFAYDQADLSFEVMAFNATETEAKAALAELEAAIARLQFELTVTVGDSPSLVYVCDAGEAIPVRDRSYVDLKYVHPKWSVSIPCYPIPTEV